MDTPSQRDVAIRKFAVSDVVCGHPIEIGALIMLAVDGAPGPDGAVGHSTELVGPGRIRLTIRVVIETLPLAPLEAPGAPGVVTLPS